MSVRRRSILTGVFPRFLLLVLGTCARSLRSGIAGCSTQTIGSTAVVGIWNLRMRGAVEGNVEGNVEDVWEVAKELALGGLEVDSLPYPSVVRVKSNIEMCC